MADDQSLSIIVPTLNEAGNIRPLLDRINNTLMNSDIDYEVIIVDDHSTDGTVEIVKSLESLYPVTLNLKKGKRGKAYSLLEGFELSNRPIVAMIDADLQYKPEEILPMYNLLMREEADLVITERYDAAVSLLRKLTSSIFNFFFAKLLFGISYDTQSGLKLFRKSILKDFELSPSPWSFDLEFIIRALEKKLKIVNHSIIFDKRASGITKVKVLSVTAELIKASLNLRLNTSMELLRDGYKANSINVKKSAAPIYLLAAILLLGTTSLIDGHVSAEPLTHKNTIASVQYHY